MHYPSSKGSSYDPTKPDSLSENSLCIALSSPCLNLKVFYVRLSNCEFHESSPEQLTLNYIPLAPEAVVEVNGRRSGLRTAFASSTLRRDRIDENSEEAIFISTDKIRMTGSMIFEVYGREKLLFSGVLEQSMRRRWSMECEAVMSGGGGFHSVKGKQLASSEAAIEVYVTGLLSGSAIILTKTLLLGKEEKKKKMKKNGMRLTLDSVPEDEATAGVVKKVLHRGPQQLMNYEDFLPPENDGDVEHSSVYRRSEYIEVDDGELSLFTAGVSVGVGIGLSICLCVGIATSLLFRTYNTTARNFKRLL